MQRDPLLPPTATGGARRRTPTLQARKWAVDPTQRTLLDNALERLLGVPVRLALGNRCTEILGVLLLKTVDVHGHRRVGEVEEGPAGARHERAEELEAHREIPDELGTTRVPDDLEEVIEDLYGHVAQRCGRGDVARLDVHR